MREEYEQTRALEMLISSPTFYELGIRIYQPEVQTAHD